MTPTEHFRALFNRAWTLFEANRCEPFHARIVALNALQGVAEMGARCGAFEGADLDRVADFLERAIAELHETELIEAVGPCAHESAPTVTFH